MYLTSRVTTAIVFVSKIVQAWMPISTLLIHVDKNKSCCGFVGFFFFL